MARQRLSNTACVARPFKVSWENDHPFKVYHEYWALWCLDLLCFICIFRLNHIEVEETKFQLTISSTPLIAAILIGVFFAEKDVHVIVIEIAHKDNYKLNQNIFPLKSLNAVLEIYLEQRLVEGVRAWVAE